MLMTTTHGFEGREIQEYRGIVFGEVIAGIRSKGYEDDLLQAREEALQAMAERAKQLGCNAVVGVKMDYESLGPGGVLMVTCSGTAVLLR